MNSRLFTAISIVVSAVVAAPGQTPLSNAFTYQGRLESTGSPANGLHDLRFRLYGESVGGALVGTVLCIDNVNVADGLFTVALDFGAQFAGQERFLEIDVRADTGLGCGSGAGFVTLSPRQALTAAPNALFASNADLIDGLDSTAFLQSIPVPLTLSGTSNTHIIRGENASTAVAASGVYGSATGTNTTNYGVFGQSASMFGTGVYGYATSSAGIAYGGQFLSASTSGRGVLGYATAFSGSTQGVYGLSDSTSGSGVFGYASAATGITSGVYGESASTSARAVLGFASASNGTNMGVYGESASTSGRGVYGFARAINGTNTGVYGESYSTLGRGVFGSATGSDSYGGYFQSEGTSGRGVLGSATASTGQTFGGSFESSSTGTNAAGVFGLASAASGTTYGVWGQSNSTSGYGVIGISTPTSGFTYGVYGRSASTNGIGVFGWATAASGAIYGVYGQAVYTPGPPYGPEFGVFANGDMGGSGNKAFRIDHPDDPENKYLLHYCHEGSEPQNVYNGVVRVDGRGEALVELPAYFAKINKNPRYTLTAVGAPMPMLHVTEEIDEAALSAGSKAMPGEAAGTCSFRIAGGAPGAKVSWEVKAVRNDRWVQQHGAPVEVEKVGLEIGTYQHPDLYGQPDERGMNYRPESERPSAALSNPNETTSSGASAPK